MKTLSRRQLLSASAVFALAAPGQAQQKEERQDKDESRTERFLAGIYSDQAKQLTFRPDFPGGFAAWQNKARPALESLLGLPRIAAHNRKHSPRVSLGNLEELKGFTRQAATILTERDVPVPFWILRPPGKGPFPLAVLPHGHDRRGPDTYAGVYHNEAHRKDTITKQRDVGIQSVKRGFLTLVPAIRGLADKAPGVPDKFKRHGERDCRSHFMHCILAGRTAIGERVWDMSRLIDWGTKLPDVDATRLLMMGNSGGGVVTMFAAAVDKRISVAVPSCSFSVIASRTGRIYHCDCCAIPGILGWGELYDVCGLVAPRHLLAVSGLKDSLHSNDDIRRSASRVQQIFTAGKVSGHFQHQFGPHGHRFYSDLMWPFVMSAVKRT